MVKRSQTSCSCGDPEVNYLLFVFSEKLSLWVGWVYWVVGFIEDGGFGVFCLFVRVGFFVLVGVFRMCIFFVLQSSSFWVFICSPYQLFCS